MHRKRIAAMAASIVIGCCFSAKLPGSITYPKALFAAAELQSRDGNSIIVDGKVFAVTRDCKGDTWAFDSDTKTLTLTGYDGMYIDLGAQEEVTIEVSGVNKVSSHLDVPAIIADGDVHVTGEGELQLYTSVCHSALCSRTGVLTIADTTLYVSATGDSQLVEPLLSASGTLEIHNSKVTINDEAGINGSAVGSLIGDIVIDTGSSIDIKTNAMGIAATDGALQINGSNTKISITSSGQSVYAKKGMEMTDGAVLSAVCSIDAGTAVFCPDGTIRIASSDISVDCGKTAMAGEFIVLVDAYLADPLDGEIKEVSSMKTIVLEDNVVGKVQILRGEAPTPTPSPTPTRRPVTPVPTKINEDFLAPVVTKRMLAGAALVVVSLITIAVIVIRKIRSRDSY